MLRALTLAFILCGGALHAQEVTRTELSRADVPGGGDYEVIVARLEIPPGAAMPRHFHHGDEHLVVIEGGEMETGGGDVIPFPSGMAAHFPAGVAHGGLTNTSGAAMVAITTHVVEKGKPLNVIVE